MKYKKDGVTIEAFKWTVERDADNFKGLPWMLEAFGMPDSRIGVARIYIRNGERFMEIKKVTGVIRVHPGSYIIRHESGDLSSSKPDIFEATYEKVKQ